MNLGVFVSSFLCVVGLAPLASAQEVWRGDFETGDTSQWNSELNGTVAGMDQITVVDDVVTEGSHAARIELVNDAAWPNGLKRVELHHSPSAGRTAEGEELYFAWSFYLPETLPTDPSAQIAYWETNSSYSQLMAFTLIGADLRFSTNHPSWTAHWTGAGVVTPSSWHRIAMHILWSTDAGQGTVDVWFDGEQVVSGAHAATLVDANEAFTQLGLLRGAIEFTDAPVIYVDDVVEGDSLASVRPDALSALPDAGMPMVDGGSAGPDTGTALDAAVARSDTGRGSDAGVDPPASGGCGCRAARRARAMPGVGLLLALAVMLRARRRPSA